MAVDPFQIQPTPSGWRHGFPYLLIALGVHAVAFAIPANLLFRQEGLPPLPAVVVSLAQPVAAADSPPVVVQAAAITPAVERAKPRVRPTPARPVLAMAPDVDPRPSVPVVTAALPVALDAKAPGEPPHFPGPAPLVAARFDAAYLNNPRPVYPAASRRLGEEGRVVVKVRVAADGRALAVDLEKSSNFERLDEAACQAVARWRFVPARRGDEALESSVLVPLVFRLDD